MIRLYVILSLCFLLEGALIVQKHNKKNILDSINSIIINNNNTNKDNSNNNNKTTKENYVPTNNSLSEQKDKNFFKSLEQEYDEGETEVIVHLLNDRLVGPTDINSVDKLKCNLNEEILQEIESYKHVVEKIIKLVLYGDFKGKTFDTLAQLTDTFGARMTGSKELEDSIDWILKKSKEENLENIHTEPVKAPHWVRNNESLHLLYPRKQKLNILGLGSSIGTPPEGIRAWVLVVKTFEELENNAEKAKGSIVVFNPDWTTYREMVQYRVYGASRAVKVGAVASLVRSVTPFSINSPHTGWQHYDESTHKIPTACITTEDAQMLQRYQDKGENALLHLFMGAQNFPDVVTRNTVTELVGYELPDEVVVVSGHLDSWDIGVGAMDDGGGSIISWVAPVILRKLGLRSKRTIRTVLFTGEEQGLYGGKAYFEKHSSNKDKFQLILESDSGTFNPLGLSFSGNNEAECIMNKVLSLFGALNTTELVTPMDGGPDIIMWEKEGVPTGSVLNSNDRYFWFHHSAGDTMSVEDSETLDKCAALWTAVAYIVGDLNVTLPR